MEAERRGEEGRKRKESKYALVCRLMSPKELRGDEKEREVGEKENGRYRVREKEKEREKEKILVGKSTFQRSRRGEETEKWYGEKEEEEEEEEGWEDWLLGQ